MIEEKTLKKILLSFIGIFALLAFIALGPAPGVMAADSSPAFADSYDGYIQTAHCAGPESLIMKFDFTNGLWVMAPPDPASGMKMGFAAVVSDNHIITSGTSALMIGGAAPAFSKPRSFI